MTTEYIYQAGQRVMVTNRPAEITGMVPGNGRPGEEWYFVRFDDGREDRFQRSDIQSLYQYSH